MEAKFLDHNNRELTESNEDRATATRTAKKQWIWMSKTTTFHVHHVFSVLFLAVVARLQLETSRFMEWVNTAQKFSFAFS